MKNTVEKASVQIGLRVPESVNARLEEQAKRIGVSKNSLVLLLINLGFKVMESDITFHPAE